MSHTTSAPVSTTPRSSGPATSVPCGCSSRALHSTVVSAHRTPVMSGGTVSSLRSPARIVNLGGRPETMGRSLMVSHDTGRSVADRPPAGSAPTLADETTRLRTRAAKRCPRSRAGRDGLHIDTTSGMFSTAATPGRSSTSLRCQTSDKRRPVSQSAMRNSPPGDVARAISLAALRRWATSGGGAPPDVVTRWKAPWGTGSPGC